VIDFENRTLGKYEVGRMLGKGSMGLVYLGNDPFSGREVAIKIAIPESLNDENSGGRYRKLFFNEAKVAGRLRHPNIVEVHDAGVESEVCFIVMEYVAGGMTLHDYCRPERLLPLEDVVRIVFKCARALDYAHRQGVVHRDIKPRNILLTEGFDVKIGDFGIALMMHADNTATQLHGYVGSPLYMSLEQVLEGNIGSPSDLFALGVVMYELLTGKHPFAGDSLAAIIHQITQRSHVPVRELRSDVPRVLSHIIDRLLKKKPAARYKTGLDLAADLSLVFDHLQLFQEELSGREKFKLVRELHFFDDFAEPEIWEVINASSWLEFESGARIIIEGEMDSSFYVIVSGEVEVHKSGATMDVLGAGDCFGEMGFIAHRERSASIVARTNVTALKVKGALIERASLACQLRFHKVFLNTLITRLSTATERIAETSI